MAEPVEQKYGLLTVTGPCPQLSGRGAYVMVRCECGAERPASLRHLRRGKIRTCGAAEHRSIAEQKRLYTVQEVAAIARRSREAAREKRNARRVTGGFKTYALIAAGLVKIGKAHDVDERLFKLQTMCPVPLTLGYLVAEDIENELHNALRRHNSHGEWFEFNEEVRDLLARRMSTIGISLWDRALNRLGTVRCRRCGAEGHYAKTCGRRTTTPATTGRKNKCGRCGAEGHNRQRCTAVESIAHRF